jgi:hypothetical protein
LFPASASAARDLADFPLRPLRNVALARDLLIDRVVFPGRLLAFRERLELPLLRFAI